MDFRQRVVLGTHSLDRVPGPEVGVWRKPLVREDAERGTAIYHA